VLAPAIGLITVGALGMVLGIALLGTKLAGRSLMDKDDGEPPQGMGLIMLIASHAITYRGSIISMSWGLSVLCGGIQMKNLSHYKTVLGACILALLPGNPCCLLGLPFGIWGLVAINRWDVKREFDYER
jgi:hypothetical protein